MNYTDRTTEAEELSGMGTVGGEYVTLPLCEKRVSLESMGEYTLPDGQPEIRRVLSVTPTVLPPAKYVGAAGVELSGNVDYSALYVGADGALYSLPLSSEYHLMIPLEHSSELDPMGGVTVWSDLFAESVQARVASPRRISLRCRLGALVRAYGRMLMEEKCIGESSAKHLFRRVARCEALALSSGRSDVLPLSCEFLGVGEDARVVTAEGSCTVNEIRISSGESVTASGEVHLRLLVARESGALETLSRSVAFSGEAELEGIDEGYDFRGTATLSELTVEVGEGGRIDCALSVIVEVRGMKNCEKSYTEDLFSTERESSCEKKSYRLPTALRCERRNFSQSERIARSGVSIPEGARICDAWGSVSFEDCSTVGQKYVLTGQSRYTMLCEKDGEYSACELILPIRYETEAAEGEAESFSAEGRVISCRARAEGEVVCLDAEIAVAADFCGAQEIVAVSAARFGEPIAERGSRMTVYYPMPNESAWDVAKKYRIAPETVKKASSYYYF